MDREITARRGSANLERLLPLVRAAARALGIPLLAIIVAFVVGALVVAFAGKSPIAAYASLLQGSFGSSAAFGVTLLNAIPLMFTGLAVAFSFRGGLFNVGGEGQLFAGAMVAAWLGVALPFRGPLAIVVILVAGALAGALLGALPGALKAWRGANEIVTTIMLNYVATYVTAWAVLTPLSAKTGFPGTLAIPPENRLPLIDPSLGRAHWGFVLCFLVALLVYLILWRTSWGFDIRVTGLSPSAARYAGIPVERNMVLVMAISGAMAGLAGAVEVLGVYGKMMIPFVTGLGFNGIAVALVGRLNPVGVVLGAFLLGALQSGGQQMQFDPGVPVALVQIIIGLILFIVTVSRMPPQLRRLWSELSRPARRASSGGTEGDTGQVSSTEARARETGV